MPKQSIGPFVPGPGGTPIGIGMLSAFLGSNKYKETGRTNSTTTYSAGAVPAVPPRKKKKKEEADAQEGPVGKSLRELEEVRERIRREKRGY